jgi:hypothetical protein
MSTKNKGGSQTTTSSQDTSSSTQLPDWLTNAAREAVARGVALSNQNPVPFYQGEAVANQSPDTLAAYQAVRNLQGSADPAFGAARDAWGGLIGQANPITGDEINALSSSLYGNYNANAGARAQDDYAGALGQTQQQLNWAKNQSQDYFSNAQANTQGLLGSYLANAGPATAAQVGANATALMSPYTQQVIDPALRAGQQQLALAQQGISAKANQVGAFGGSRQGVESGVADAQTALGTQQYIGNMLNTGWGQALTPAYNLANNASQQGYNAGALLGQQGYGAAGQLATQGSTAANTLASQGYGAAGQLAGLGATAYGQGLGAGQGVANTDLQSGLLAAQQLPGQAVTQANLGQQQAAALQASGSAQQQHEQQIIDEQMANWQAVYNQPYQNLDTLLASVGAVPYGTSTTGTAGSSTTQKTDPGLLNTIGAYVGFASKLGSTAASAVKG